LGAFATDIFALRASAPAKKHSLPESQAFQTAPPYKDKIA
jgi:hypothetical protein